MLKLRESSYFFHKFIKDSFLYYTCHIFIIYLLLNEKNILIVKLMSLLHSNSYYSYFIIHNTYPILSGSSSLGKLNHQLYSFSLKIKKYLYLYILLYSFFLFIYFYSKMILTQVHLRKPCYDFSFL